MSTCITQDGWEIVIYDQLELLTDQRFFEVDVWTNYDLLELGKAKQLFSTSNFDWDKKELTKETLSDLVNQAVKFIEGENNA